MTSLYPVENTRLWQQVAQEQHLAETLRRLRERANRMAGLSVATQPAMTDHTARHFDALWGVAEHVLRLEEISRLNPTEAFLLGATFYVHDLGMSYGLDEEAKAALRRTPEYIGARQRLGGGPELDRHALEMAIRQTHATRAVDLCVNPLAPGTDEYLIESKTDRDLYGHYIGTIASSHHWPIQRLKRDLGDKGRVAFGTAGAQADVGLIAAYLRVIDFAHINRDRSSSLERALRPAMPAGSLEHWLGQEQVNGPIREDDYLKYTSSRPISSVDGWWLFYGMMRGLDEEIRATRRFLESRPDTVDALALRGVKGSEDPDEAARYLVPDGFLPLDVRVKTDSIARIVELLGGKTLYGDSPLPAIRELVQNSMDAIRLRRAVGQRQEGGEIVVELRDERDASVLIVSDDGIGMNADIIRDYLLAVASDYWVSDRFASDVGRDIADSFRPAGRFGVGFLSVFMLGDEIEVRSQRGGHDQVMLRLRGKDRVGELRKSSAVAQTGTEIRVKLTDVVAKRLENAISALPDLFPMTDVAVRVKTQKEEYASVPETWRTEDVVAFLNRVRRTSASLEEATSHVRFNEHEYDLELWSRYYRHRVTGLLHRTEGDQDFGARDQWGDAIPDLLGDGYRVVAVTQGGVIVLCSRGIAVCTMPCPGYVGMIGEENVDLDVSRTRPVGYDLRAKSSAWASEIQPKVRGALERRARMLSLPSMHKHIGTCLSLYGDDLLAPSPLPWIWCVVDGQISALCSDAFQRLIHSKGRFAIMYKFGPLAALKWTDRIEELRGLPLVVQPDALTGNYGVEDVEPTDEEQVHRGDLRSLLPGFEADGLLVGVLSLAAKNHNQDLSTYLARTRWALHRSGPMYGRRNDLYGICEG